ncbi:MAG: hypothetical protein RJB39_316 [Candidatus Parcubacteria bacterium]|jgi:flagellin-specific chaperone FliS
MLNNKDNIPHMLEGLKSHLSPRFKKSLSLTDAEKHNLFARIISNPVATPKYAHRVASPFVNSFSIFFRRRIQYGMYALPIILIAFFANYSDAFSLKLKSWFEDFNNTKNEIVATQSAIEAKLSLSRAQRGISELKSSEDDSQKTALASQVSVRSQEVRNRVAALVKENKIAEAKEIALDLEAALKADELFAMSPAVAEEVFAATDLRVELEKKERVNIAFGTSSATSTLVADLQVKIDGLKKELDGFASTSSSSPLIADARATLEKAEKYLAESKIEETVITLQACDRIVAEVRLLLLK